jgi:FlaA1/EpsC-like NDP-sugar epimerase
MGASKKLMEDVILAYAKKIPITTARFANVAFSNGSLLFGFIERMMKRQPLSSPTDVKRYFVSPEESGQICMLACMLGESGQIFFPKLREDQMKTFSNIGISFLKEFGNYEPEYCKTEQEAREKILNLFLDADKYPVYFFPTDTSGEKKYEEFFVPGEDVDMETFEQLGVIRNIPSKSMEAIDELFEALHKVFGRKRVTKKAIVELIGDFIPNFKHIETGKSLDQKM